MKPTAFAFTGGLVLFSIGMLALIPSWSGSSHELPLLWIEASYGRFLGLFPMNIVNKLMLVTFGGMGLVVASLPGRERAASVYYARAVFFIFGALTVLGVIWRTNTLGGYMPVLGLGVLLHGLVAAAGYYYGFVVAHETARTSLVFRQQF